MNIKTAFALTLTAAFLSTTAPLLAETMHPVTGEKLSDNQTLTYRLLDQFPTLDPQLNEETSGFHVIRDLFEGLLSQDENGNLIPGVATEWAASNGNTTWTFTLREDAKWSNGDPVTAGDFVYGWQRAADPATASPYAWYVELTSMVNAAEIIAGDMDPSTLGVKALDDYTLEVSLTQPLPYFPAMTTYGTLFPAHQATIEEHGSEWTAPGNIVSNGAFVLTELKLNEFHTREKNPMYWDADNVILEKVTGLIINDANQALTRYFAGELDYMDDLPPGRLPSLQADYPDEAFVVPRLCSYYYAFNHTDTGHPALQDERVREALSMSIDRDVITQNVLKGGQLAAYNFTHAATAGFEMPEIEYGTWSQAERDAKAKELMADAGWGTGGEPLNLKLIYNTSESHKAIATVVSQMWRQKLGVTTELANFEWKTYLEIRGNQEFDIGRSAWCGDYNEASTFLDLVTTTHGANDGKYSNARVDELMAASKTAENPQEMYTEVEQILADEMGIAPIYHYTQSFMKKPDIKGWPLNNVENNWYSKNHYRVASE
ncbi:MAG: peptide ABC transporter substrate-binding protein [Pseudomonadota bacterium]